VAFSPDSQYISGALQNGTIEVWDLQGNLVATFKGHTQRALSVSFNPDPNLLVFASSSSDNTAKLWQLNHHPRLTVLKPPVSLLSPITDVSISADGTRVAASREDSQVTIWNLKNVQHPILDSLPYKGINDYSLGMSISLTPNGKVVAAANADGSIEIWETSGKDADRLENAHGGKAVRGISFSSQNDLLASAGSDHLVKIWNASESNTIIRSLSGHQEPVNRAKFDLTSRRLASTSDDKTAIVWDSQSGSRLFTLAGHNAAVWGVSFNPANNSIATSSDDKTVKLWDTKGKMTNTLLGHTDSVNSVQFSSDGSLLFSAGADRTIKVWRSDGTYIATLFGHQDTINGLSLVDSTLVSGSSDGAVILWNANLIDLDRLITVGCDWIRDYIQSSTSKNSSACFK
jgi:WD40 repeat protein